MDRLHAAITELAAAIIDVVERPPNEPDRLLSVGEAGGLMGLGRSRVYNEIASGRLATLKVGRRRLVPLSSIQAWYAKLR